MIQEGKQSFTEWLKFLIGIQLAKQNGGHIFYEGKDYYTL